MSLIYALWMHDCMYTVDLCKCAFGHIWAKRQDLSQYYHDIILIMSIDVPTGGSSIGLFQVSTVVGGSLSLPSVVGCTVRAPVFGRHQFFFAPQSITEKPMDSYYLDE